MSVVTNATRSPSIMAQRASKEILIEHGLREPGWLWIQSTPKETSDSVRDQERKRREAINEIIHTERDFVRDLEYLRDRWVEPLRTWSVIPENRRSDFVQQVFWNIEDILNANARLYGLLNANPTIETIGKIFAEMVPHFHSFVEYGRHQPYGKNEFESEKLTNPTFAAFAETVERLPESRRLGLNVYLIKPVVHLARYPPMLEVVLKHTPESKPDRVAIPRAIKMIHEFLAKLYEERGNTENRLSLIQLEKRLVFRPGEEVDLGLKDEHRQLMHRGPLEHRRGSSNKNDVLHAFLFDHAFLIVKNRMIGQHEQWEVFKRPIPLELLAVFTLDGDAGKVPKPRSSENERRLMVRYCGRNGYTLTLWAPTLAARYQWVKNVTAQQKVICEQNMIFNTFTLSEGVFLGDAKVNCVVPYDFGRRFAYGTDNGVYVQSLDDDQTRRPIRKLSLANVQQIDILEDYQLLIILTERSVVTFPLDVFDVEDPVRPGEYPLKRMKQIASHTSFFKVGYCLGRALVCIVDAHPSNSTIKVFKPIEQSIYGRSRPTFKKLAQGGNDTLEVFKEFYIPSKAHSVNFLKTKLCVVFTTGFEIVDLETLDTQALLDPLHISLDFVRRHNDVRPLNIYLIDGEFLLCYTEFAFFVNRSGERSENGVVIYWEGTPTAFALHYPYVMAFDPTFIEVRHVKDGKLVQIGGGKKLRLLFADAQPSVKNSTNSTVPISRVRDEIILVSGDKVMAVRPARHPARQVR